MEMKGKDIREDKTSSPDSAQNRIATSIAKAVVPLRMTVIMSARGITTAAFSTSSAT